MKKLSIKSPSRKSLPLPVALVFWKVAKNEILEQYLRDPVLSECAKMPFNISDEQLKRIRSTGNVTDAVRSRIFKGCQQARELAAVIVEGGGISLLEHCHDNYEELSERWQVLLALLCALDTTGIELEWIQDEAVIASMLDSEEDIDLDIFRDALAQMRNLMEVRHFVEDKLPEFLHAYSEALKSIIPGEDPDLEKCGEIQMALAKVSKLKRSFINGVRALKKQLEDTEEGWNILARILPGYTNDVWVFANRLSGNSEAIIKAMIDHVLEILPEPMNTRKISAFLRELQPPLSRADMATAQSELDDIENGVLDRNSSQLWINIIPAMTGDRAFDAEAFEAAEESGQSYPYSYMFIKKLLANTWHVPMSGSGGGATRSERPAPMEKTPEMPPREETAGVAQDTQEEMEESAPLLRDNEQTVIGKKEETGVPFDNSSASSSEQSEEYEGESAEEERDTDSEDEEIVDIDISSAPSGEMEDILPKGDAGDNGKIADAVLPPDEAETATEDVADPFDVYEEILDAAMPEADDVSPVTEKEECVKEADSDNAIKDPLEKKFARMMQARDMATAENKHAASIPVEERKPNIRSQEPVAEKKSSLTGASRTREKGDSENFEGLVNFLERNVDKQEDEPGEPADWHETFSKILKLGELPGLVWLARALGEESPAPAWLIELLYLGGGLVPRYGNQGRRILELSAEATENLDKLDDPQILLLAAAILRPVLMMPDKTMATIVSFLSNRLSNYALTRFFRSLEGFIQRGHAVEASIFTGQSQSMIMERSHERLLAETDEFIYRIRNTKLVYQPASHLRSILFSENGEVGRVLKGCLAGDYTGLESFVRAYADDKSIEKLIDNTSVPNRTRLIEASARKRLITDIRQAVNIATQWHEYVTLATNAEGAGYSEKAFYDLFSSVPKEISRLVESIEGEILKKQLDILAACGSRRLPESDRDPEVELALWPLRSPRLSIEQPNPPLRIADAILSGNARDEDHVAASIVYHLAYGELESCEAFLKQYPEIAGIVPDMGLHPIYAMQAGPASVRDLLEQAREIWKRKFETAHEQVGLHIANCVFRGALHTQQHTRYTALLSAIEDKYREYGDKASGVRELKMLRSGLDRLEELQAEQIRERMQVLKQRNDLTETSGRIEEKLATHLAAGMYNLAWDDVAEMESYFSDQDYTPAPQSTPTMANAAHEFYERLDAGDEKLSHGTPLPVWTEASREIKTRVYADRMDSRAMGIITEFVRRLGFNLRQDVQPQIVHTTGKPNNWRAIRFQMEIEGPLPQWSSTLRRHIVAFGWNVSAEDINQLLSADKMDNEDCKTVICFNPLDMAARKKLISMCASRNVAPLVIDQNLSAFMAEREPSEWKDIMFRVCLAGSSLIPYTDVGGAVPKEMFFGRQNDIRALTDKLGPCIVYGGRQLGKSALLQQIYNSAKSGLKVLLHSMSNSESSLMEAIRRECALAGIVDKRATLNTLPENIEKWLDANPDLRLLVLLDECDRALDVDALNKFSEVSRLRDLMTKTARRFKVVLTGLHSVQRFSQISNQPFLHFGEPLCIGPLATDAAHDLMVKPLSLLGLEFENDQLVQIALNHCGYQPKLIQIFCIELLKAIGQRRSVPFQKIDAERIQKIYTSQNLKKKIVECFDMTLNLDDRYLVIGYVLAIYNNASLGLQQLLGELSSFWPAAFDSAQAGANGSDMLNTLKSLLHEMEGLGLVTGLDNQYRLRTPNVIDLLGGEDHIYSRLDPYAKKPYRKEANQDELRVDAHGVFVASQYNLLAEKNNLFCWISGCRASGLDYVPQALKDIAQDQGFAFVRLKGATPHDLFQDLRDNYHNLGDGGMLCWTTSEEFPFMEAFMAQASQWFASLRTGKKFIKIVCILGPDTLHDFIRTGHAERFSSTQMQLLPWSLEGIEIHVREKGIPGLDAGRIYKESGGWTKLVTGNFSPARKEQPSLASDDFWPGQRKELTSLVTLLNELGNNVLNISAKDENASFLFEMMGNSGLPDAQSLAHWLETLRSLRILRESGEFLNLDPIAAGVLAGQPG